jgi:hypothetical protein
VDNEEGLAAVGLAPISGRGADFSFWLAVRSRQRSHALARNYFRLVPLTTEAATVSAVRHI